MGLFDWLFKGSQRSSTRRQSVAEAMPPPLQRAVPDGETRTDLGSIDTGVTVNGVPLVFTATMTTYDEVPAWMREGEHGQSAARLEWRQHYVADPVDVVLHYRQNYRGRPESRLVEYTCRVEEVVRAGEAFKLIGPARAAGKSYSHKAFPGDRIEVIATVDGEIIEDVAAWLDRLSQPSSAQLAWRAAQGVTLHFDPPLELRIGWRVPGRDGDDQYRASITTASWPSFERGVRLEGKARRVPSYVGQTAWAGNKVFYQDQIAALANERGEIELTDAWGWLVDNAASQTSS